MTALIDNTAGAVVHPKIFTKAVADALGCVEGFSAVHTARDDL